MGSPSLRKFGSAERDVPSWRLMRCSCIWNLCIIAFGGALEEEEQILWLTMYLTDVERTLITMCYEKNTWPPASKKSIPLCWARSKMKTSDIQCYNITTLFGDEAMLYFKPRDDLVTLPSARDTRDNRQLDSPETCR